MIRGALQQDDYFKGQAVEVRNTHFGRERWRPAKIHRRTSRGCEVIYQDGTDTRPQHIMLSDLRPVQASERERTPKIGTRVLSADDIDRLNAQLEAEAKAKAEEAAKNPPPPPPPPPPQTLVLLKRPEPPPPPPPAESMPMPTNMGTSRRRPRTPKVHQPTVLSNYLREARGKKQLKQGDVAKLTDITRMSDIELGDICPTDNELQNLAIALDLDLQHLLRLRDEPTHTMVATHEAAPPAEREPDPELEKLRKEIAQMRYRMNQLTEENAGLRASRREPAPVSHDVAALREENEVLRAAVVFYCGVMQ